MHKQTRRPVFLNLFQIRFPPTAIASILHRFSGVFIILSLPFLIYLFDLSLRDQKSFSELQVLGNNPLVECFLYLLLWSISHHFLAGIRYFLFELEILTGKQQSRVSAIAVVLGGLLIPLLVLLERSW